MPTDPTIQLLDAMFNAIKCGFNITGFAVVRRYDPSEQEPERYGWGVHTLIECDPLMHRVAERSYSPFLIWGRESEVLIPLVKVAMMLEMDQIMDVEETEDRMRLARCFPIEFNEEQRKNRGSVMTITKPIYGGAVIAARALHQSGAMGVPLSSESN